MILYSHTCTHAHNSLLYCSQFEQLSHEDIKVGEEQLHHLYNNTYDLPTAEGDNDEGDVGGAGDGVLGIEEEGQEHRQRHGTSKYHNGVGSSNLTQSEEKELKLKRDNYTDYASGI